MRGEVDQQPTMFSYVDLESRIPKQHPIRKIRKIVDKALPALEVAFNQMYSDRGRPSIPVRPEYSCSLRKIVMMETIYDRQFIDLTRLA